MVSSLFIFKSPIIFSFYLLLLLLVSAEGSKCPQSFDCGSHGQISFPFTDTEHPQCGALAIHGCHDKDPVPPKTIQLTKSKRSFNVIIMGRSTITVSDNDQQKNLENRSCKAFFNNFTLPPPSPLVSFYVENNITMFRCNNSLKVTLPKSFHNYTNSNCSGYNIYYYSHPNSKIPPGFKWPRFLASPSCSAVQVAVKGEPTDNPFDFLAPELLIEVQLSDDCNHCLRHKGGQCQLDIHGNFYCATENKSLLRKLGLGIGFPSIIITGLLIIWHYKRRHVPDFPDPERGSSSVCFGIPIFSYKDLQVATKNFDRSRELGEGGFGIVFYGKLKDGREVAVKRLYEHNYRRVEQFVNEVNILTRLRHKNLVSLYGCTSRHGHELLLVYEYIPNGTVASHLRRESTNPGFLPWNIRMKVALETAIALAYLHASDIIHRDVKTNNILLDNNFCVKVADFGLSRLFPNDVTHVSTAPQGTPGYVDPEYHQCYQLTSKSDVYSFGVVLIELISSMPAVDMSRHKDEINLANLAIRKIRKSAIGELVDPFLGFESDRDVRREIVSIAELAFQCLQRDKELRPSMDEAVEVLRRIESGEDEPGPGHVEEVISHGNVVHPLSPSSPDHDEVKLLTPSSPKAVTDKWGSESTTPNVSGQSQSQI